MELNRADVQSIAAAERDGLLERMGLAGAKPIAAGTEAEVYAYDRDIVLKIYAGAGRRGYFETLRALYAGADASGAGFRLPAIREIIQHGGLVALLETKLPGAPLEDALPGLAGAALRRAEDLYLDAAVHVQAIRLAAAPGRYLLFDETDASSAGSQSFGAWYAGLLRHKLERVGGFLGSDDPAFAEQAALLAEIIAAEPDGPLALVHGDFFPGNVLASAGIDAIEGVIDFGSFTMFGSAVIDAACAFSYYRQYAPDRRQIRRRLLPRLLERLPAADHGAFFRFLLANAILTADLYAPGPDPRGDGHFEWAREIVGERDSWRRAIP